VNAQPNPLDAFQPIRIFPQIKQDKKLPRLRLWPLFILFFFVVLFYFLAPLRENILILGVDAGLARGDLGRSDTIILATVSPLRPYVGLLSIPRDLWLAVPGVGENRINTAYFFAEAQEPGSGPRAATEVVMQNFHVPVSNSIVLRMDGLVGIINAMGGVEITLEKPTSGYAAGNYHLNGQEALAFTRSRAGSDDFARMAQGQTLLKAVMRRLLQPDSWEHLPQISQAFDAAVDVNIPAWQWPRLGLALLRAGPDGIDARAITRQMVMPFTTTGGAQVLAPNWEAITPMMDEMFRSIK
jgi:LCP family protein required for cell wall assembly